MAGFVYLKFGTRFLHVERPYSNEVSRQKYPSHGKVGRHLYLQTDSKIVGLVSSAYGCLTSRQENLHPLEA